MKKIAYIEIDTHAEIAQSFIEIMQGSGEFAVDYYFSEKIKNQIETHDESVFLSDSSMILEQLKIKKYDVIIVGTVHRYFNTFQAIAEKYNTAFIIHNINFTKISRLDLLKNIFKEDIVYRLKLWWKEGLFYTSKTYEKAKNLLVLDEELCSGKFKFLPLFYTKYFEKPKNKVFTVVIPGGVSQKRRDYRKVFSTIKELENLSKNSNIENKMIEFVFLGKAKNQELKQVIDLERCLNYINVQYFTERVSPKDFEYWMQKADVLWCPIQQETTFFSQKETYGVTKMTGNLGDAIKYGKLAVFPQNYSSKLEFIVSEKQDVIRQLQELKNSDFDFQTKYNKELVQKNIENVLNELISI
ncbi:glycosyltransferase family protein [Chryseobacterium oryctis]|uniref:Uncharacterized protein n=1 Tax=Chryseobacterium oryctis TaxID=2952618 RepID=A0ABT3HP25_9FLAO|nr:hypothetical protein [Chryseobacterium oryctis]MCW3161368.1 hypothetical protein [Chryseobacterium oryctis]